MFQSGLSVVDGSTVRTGVCIVGSGPAGLTVASELVAAGLEVVLVESGGRDFQPLAQELSQVTHSELALVNVVENRRRQVGGNSNVWVVKMVDLVMGVRYAPLDPIDFAGMAHQSETGWPFGLDELRPHYEAAQQICQAGPFDYSPDTWSAGTDGPWALDSQVVDSKVFRFGPKAAFHDHLAASVGASPRATVIHDATAVELLADDGSGPVTGVRCRTLGGSSFVVEADRFVLATGGLGNPHLLLASRSDRPAGIGNQHDLVGRFLQDHPLIAGGSLELFDRATWPRSTFYDMRQIDGRSGLGYLALSRQAIESHGLGGLSAVLFPRPSHRRSQAMELLRTYAEAARARRFGAEEVRHLPALVGGLDYVPVALYRKLRWNQSLYGGFGRGGWSTMPGLAGKFARWEVVHQAEQSPDAENRITLNHNLDAVGMPVMNVQWRWSEADAKRAATGRRLIADELARAGVGRLQLPDDDDLPGVGIVGGTAHYMGTTRMNDDPHRGVVDNQGRVHGVPNLYVTGSSVFPNTGYANPTLTIVALAHRLARHLAG
jgi:choline dehydrogenase-like flavoprotein